MGACGRGQPYLIGAPGHLGRCSQSVCEDVKAARRYEVLNSQQADEETEVKKFDRDQPANR